MEPGKRQIRRRGYGLSGRDRVCYGNSRRTILGCGVRRLPRLKDRVNADWSPRERPNIVLLGDGCTDRV